MGVSSKQSVGTELPIGYSQAHQTLDTVGSDWWQVIALGEGWQDPS